MWQLPIGAGTADNNQYDSAVTRVLPVRAARVAGHFPDQHRHVFLLASPRQIRLRDDATHRS